MASSSTPPALFVFAMFASTCGVSGLALPSRTRTGSGAARSLVRFADAAPAEPQLFPLLFVLCRREALQLAGLRAQAAAEARLVDGPFVIDLGFTTRQQLLVLPTGVALPAGAASESPCVTWDELDEIARDKRDSAWECEAGYKPVRIETFSEATNRHAKLLPVDNGCPTAVLAGFNMHRMKGTNPVADTKEKLSAFGSLGPSGTVLDVCTGLGYTSIAASRLPGVERVTTIELDPGMVEMQRRNPWSRELFTSPKIERLLGDATVVLPGLHSGAFSCVCHDPPMSSLAGDLYGLQFYQELYRVLRPSGRLFHYIGDPDSKASGQLFKGVGARLREAGFADVKLAKDAFGLIATRS
ncbi:S-adenosyl-L-methionine-dependent methyltransferase [Pavlovales sp. CCMP2436]|nr:S-adenosyl-L-methionine-dependent methyltransferase [Pavlovales sp. CCMP2436]